MVKRVLKNGWLVSHIAKVQMHALGISNKKKWQQLKDRGRKQIQVCAKLSFGVPDGTYWDATTYLPTINPIDDLTADWWQYRENYDGKHRGSTQEVDMLLVDIARPIVNWPQDDDRLAMTACIEFACAHPHTPYTTADWDQIIQYLGYTVPAHLVLGATHDENAVRRLEAAVPNPTS